ncbi:MAG TPA: hypothetical protein VK168_04640 [Saprospiraceae bacterium]|nr:hypothetical protein [Saprospiraceae bacterium]
MQSIKNICAKFWLIINELCTAWQKTFAHTLHGGWSRLTFAASFEQGGGKMTR